MKSRRSVTLYGYIYLLGFLLLFGSCRTTRDVASRSSGSLKAEEDFFYALHTQSFRYQTLSARLQFNLVMASGKELSSRGQLKIEKNGRLQISIQPMLGIEMFRIELTPDSIKLVDRINKKFLAEDYSKLKGQSKIEFNFYNLQALFTNQLFLPGETNLPSNAFKRFRWEKSTNGYVLQTKDKKGLQYLFSADREEKLYAAKVTDNTDYTLQWDYASFRTIDNQYFPMEMNGVFFAKNKANNSVKINYSRIEVDIPLNLQFTIPAGYERVTFSQIMKLLE